MNNAEQTIIQELLENSDAKAYWDVDEHFFKKKSHSASYFLKKYFSEWNYYKTNQTNFISTNFKKEKIFRFIEAQKNISQVKYVGELLSKISDQELKNTAVVLADENLLNPLLQSLPNNVKKIICLSTDKAAYPINAMGISKALMEKVAIAASRNYKNTTVCLTRYGNVMASRGSVIPLFLNQIENDNELTITDPNMTRFLMSLDEAVELVLFAFENGNPGDLFVNKAPASNIGDLAQALKEMLDLNNNVKIIGTRHGEKLFETLCTREEMIKAEDMGDFFRIPADNRSLNYSSYFSEGEKELSSIEDYNSHNTEQKNIEGIKQLLIKLDFVQQAVKKV